MAKVTGDASFRTYYRVWSQNDSYILMDAPPEKEDSSPFVNVAHFLGKHGVPVPTLVASQPDAGFCLMQDFGDTTFLKALEQGVPAETLYRQAVDVLLTIQTTPLDTTCIAHYRPYDRKLLRFELSLLTDWLIEKALDTPITPEDRERFDKVFKLLIDACLSQPVTFVHRDYHSRNLMWWQGQTGVLDFQDAVMGPITYDLASLLRDCYVAWDAPFRRQVMDWWWQGARERLGYDVDHETFQRHFDWMAIQRNLKAVGIFGRLSRRDGKHGYLNDIPRTMGYVRETLAHYPELDELSRLLDHYLPAGTRPMPPANVDDAGRV